MIEAACYANLEHQSKIGVPDDKTARTRSAQIPLCWLGAVELINTVAKKDPETNLQVGVTAKKTLKHALQLQGRNRET